MTVSLSAERGSLFVRSALALGLAAGDPEHAEHIASKRWPDQPSLGRSLKAALMAPDGPGLVPGSGEFVQLAYARSLIGRISGLRRGAFANARTVGVGRPSFKWTGEGEAVPFTLTTMEKVALDRRKVGGSIAFSKEFGALPGPDAERILREQLLEGATHFVDRSFVDPTQAADPGVAPASITEDAAEVPTSGTDAASARADLMALLDAVDFPLEEATFLVSPRTAVALAATLDLRNLGVRGGELYGAPAFASSSVEDGTLVLLHAPSILVALGREAELSASKDASVELTDDPDGTSHGEGEGNPNHTQHVSLWASNTVGLRVTMDANWEVAREDTVGLITGAAYGSEEGTT